MLRPRYKQREMDNDPNNDTPKQKAKKSEPTSQNQHPPSKFEGVSDRWGVAWYGGITHNLNICDISQNLSKMLKF